MMKFHIGVRHAEVRADAGDDAVAVGGCLDIQVVEKCVQAVGHGLSGAEQQDARESANLFIWFRELKRQSAIHKDCMLRSNTEDAGFSYWKSW